MKVKIAVCSLAIAAIVAAGLLFAPSSLSDGVVRADGRNRGRSPTGVWFLSAPSGLTAFYAFDKDGIVSGAISSGFGGAPRPGTAKSSDNGLWRRVGRRFESAVWRFNYDAATGEAVNVTRLRFLFTLDRSSRTGSGEFFVTQWSCPMDGLECPDPNISDPTVPEFAPPGNTFTITRARLH